MECFVHSCDESARPGKETLECLAKDLKQQVGEEK